MTTDNSVGALSSYWAIDYGGTPIIIYANTTDYHIAVYQICSKNEQPCCQFISKLMVYNASAMLNDATVKCYEFLQQPQQSNATVNTQVKSYVKAEAKLSKCVFLWLGVCPCACVCIWGNSTLVIRTLAC